MKTTTSLSCESARAFPIEKALAKLGHFPTKSTEKEAWFRSPLRSETQASFKVCKKLNRWYDHGVGKGGNVIDLICLINKFSVSESLKFIGQEQTFFPFHRQSLFDNTNDPGIRIRFRQPIYHSGLIQYLAKRKISIPTASILCQEVHYHFRGRDYFALGILNISGGWELRNAYCKNSSSPKDISLIQNGNKKLIITEGMFDILSLLQVRKNLSEVYDFLILNSTAFLSRAINYVDAYDEIELYLDTDKNGKQATLYLLEYSRSCKDKSALYDGFKDVNDWLMHRAKKEFGQ